MKKFYLLISMLFIAAVSFGQYATKVDAKLQKDNTRVIKQAPTPVYSVKSTMTTIFEEGFEFTSEDLENGWTSVDNDGDGNDWFVYDYDGTQAHTGTYSMASASWSTSALTPENWLISPAIDLTSVSGTVMLSWWVGAQDLTWPAENYKVVLSTTGTNVTDFTNNLFEETLTSGDWAERSVNISAYAGETVYIAFVHYDCTDQFYLKIDDMAVYTNTTIDAEITNITAPNHDGGCTLSSTEDVTVIIKNNGGSDITGFDVSYTVNGGTPVVETVSETITPAGTLDYTFTTQADLSTLGDYTIEASVALTDDSDDTNDSFSMDIVSGDTEITIHAMTDAAGGQSWQVINNLTSEVVAERTTGWQWNVEVTETICVVDANCYNVIVSDEDGDGMVDGSAYLEILYDGTQVAGSTTPDSWTTSELIAENLGSGCAANDAGVMEIAPIYSSCDLGMTDIIVTIKNFGTSDITDVPVSYTINGGAAVTETATGTIAASATMEYTFTTQADFTADGAYSIAVYTELVDDENAANDETTLTVTNIAPASVPYSSSFNAVEDLAGWGAEDANGDESTWGYYSAGGVDDSPVMGYNYNSTNAGDDYLFSTCLNLLASEAYSLTFDYAVVSATFSEKLEVFIGDAQTGTAMTTSLIDLGTFSNVAFEEAHVANFTVPADGIYYIGFYAYSDADMYRLYVDDVTVDFATDVNDMTAPNIAIYPNPANNVVTVENAENAQITIVNMVGQIVASQVVNSNRESINISDLSNGTYVIRIENGNEISTQKLNVIR